MQSRSFRMAKRRVARAFRRVPGNILEADDLAQVAALYLWRIRDRLAGMGSSLLYLVVYRRMLDAARVSVPMLTEQGTRPEFIGWEEVLKARALRDLAESPMERLLREERRVIAEQLEWLLFSPQVGLTPGQRTAMQLRYVEGLENVRVAKICGLRETTISMHCRHGIEKMRAFLEAA